MRKSHLKRTGALLAAAMMATSALAGCGGSGSGSTAESTQSVAGESTAADKTESGGAVEETKPESTITSFRIWSNTTKPWVGYKSAEESPFHQGLNERTGITWNWEWPAEGTDRQTAYNLMLADKELPDVIYYRTNHKNAASYIEDGIIVPLNDYMEYAPNLQKLFDENEDIRKDCMTDNGDIYMFPLVNEELWLTTLGPIIREDWLAEQSLSAPETFDEWEETLKVFKDKYGATFSAFNDHTWFGLLGGTREFIINDQGKIQYGYTLDETRKSLELLAKWNQEGLLDPDFASLDNNMVKQKRASGDAGISYNNSIENDDIGIWKAIPYPVETKGDQVEYSRMTTRVDYGYGAMVTTACKDIPRVVKALDWAYGEEGSMYWNAGVEGEDYVIEDGKIRFTEKITSNPELPQIEALQQVCAQQFGGPMVRSAAVQSVLKNEATMEGHKLWVDTNMAKHMQPLVTLTKEESDLVASKTTAIASYAEEMWFSFISGDTPINDETWKAFLDQMDAMGLAEVTAARQAALDRYNAR